MAAKVQTEKAPGKTPGPFAFVGRVASQHCPTACESGPALGFCQVNPTAPEGRAKRRTRSLDNNTVFRTGSAVKGVKYSAPALPRWHTGTIATQRQIDRYIDFNGRDRRLSYCGKAVTGPVGLILSSGKARFVGIARCDSWDCPRCAASKASKSSKRLAHVLAEATARGWVPYFTTFTLAHSSDHSLSRCMRAGREGWRKVRRELGKYDFVHGHVGAWEVTLGRKGWHLHLHALIFVSPGVDVTSRVYTDEQLRTRSTGYFNAKFCNDAWVSASAALDEATHRKVSTNTQRMKKAPDVARLQRELWVAEGDSYKYGNRWNPWRVAWRRVAEAWCSGVRKSGMPAPDAWRQYVAKAKTDVTPLVNYLTKTANEICGSHNKIGRRGSWTPRGILELAAVGNQEGRRAWREYREAMAGVHRITGLPGLEKRVGKASAERVRPAIIGAIAPATYLAMRNVSMDAPLSRLASHGCVMEGAWLAKEFLGKLGEYDTPRTLKRAAVQSVVQTNLLAVSLARDFVTVGGISEWTLTQYLEQLSPRVPEKIPRGSPMNCANGPIKLGHGHSHARIATLPDCQTIARQAIA